MSITPIPNSQLDIYEVRYDRGILELAHQLVRVNALYRQTSQLNVLEVFNPP